MSTDRGRPRVSTATPIGIENRTARAPIRTLKNTITVEDHGFISIEVIKIAFDVVGGGGGG